MSAEQSPLPLVAEAAATSSSDAAAAIDRAADMNDDPEVAQVLEEAAISADQTVSRVGWLRRALGHLLPASASRRG
jgi:hypothetical protein